MITEKGTILSGQDVKTVIDSILCFKPLVISFNCIFPKTLEYII